MKVAELWRFPVKSLQGERLERVECAAEGLSGDRRFAIFDATTGFGLTARRAPELLFAAARLNEDGHAVITLPDGRPAVDDAALSEWLGRPVHLRRADEPGDRVYENPADFEDEAGSDWEPFAGSTGAFQDSGSAAVSLISTGSIGDWAQRRFRANIVLEGAGEDELVGQQIGIGTAILDIGIPIPRCVMTTRPQPDGIGRDLEVLRWIHRERGGNLAVGGLIAAAGVLSVGDVVEPRTPAPVT